MTGKDKRIRQKIAETLELPKDVIMDVPKVTITGNVQLNIENHHGILEYGDNSIRINTSIGTFKISGSKLIIKSIVSDEIVITGSIESIDISC